MKPVSYSEGTQDWASEKVLRRKLHNGRIGSKCDIHGGNKKCIQNFCWKPEKKTLVGRPKHEWENLKIDLKEAECTDMDYTLNSGHSEVAVSCEYKQTFRIH